MDLRTLALTAAATVGCTREGDAIRASGEAAVPGLVEVTAATQADVGCDQGSADGYDEGWVDGQRCDAPASDQCMDTARAWAAYGVCWQSAYDVGHGDGWADADCASAKDVAAL
jgi:hypothetical protein